MTRLSSSRADLEAGKLWLPVMICQKCGKQSTVTNICRECPEMPATSALNPEMVKTKFCYAHCEPHTVELDGKTYPATHESDKMVYSGVVEEPFLVFHKSGRELPERRAYKAKDNDEAVKLWIGWGVVFDD